MKDPYMTMGDMYFIGMKYKELSEKYYEALVRIDEIASSQFNNVIANIAREALGDAYIEQRITENDEQRVV